MEIFSKEPMLDKKMKEGEEEQNQRRGSMIEYIKRL